MFESCFASKHNSLLWLLTCKLTARKPARHAAQDKIEIGVPVDHSRTNFNRSVPIKSCRAEEVPQLGWKKATQTPSESSDEAADCSD